MTTFFHRGEGEAAPAAQEEGYESLTKEQLQAELTKRDLPTSGNKPELIERLEADDAS